MHAPNPNSPSRKIEAWASQATSHARWPVPLPQRDARAHGRAHTNAQTCTRVHAGNAPLAPPHALVGRLRQLLRRSQLPELPARRRQQAAHQPVAAGLGLALPCRGGEQGRPRCSTKAGGGGVRAFARRGVEQQPGAGGWSAPR